MLKTQKKVRVPIKMPTAVSFCYLISHCYLPLPTHYPCMLSTLYNFCHCNQSMFTSILLVSSTKSMLYLTLYLIVGSFEVYWKYQKGLWSTYQAETTLDFWFFFWHKLYTQFQLQQTSLFFGDLSDHVLLDFSGSVIIFSVLLLRFLVRVYVR